MQSQQAPIQAIDTMKKSTTMITREKALKGRAEPIQLSNHHYVLGTPIQGDIASPYKSIVFGMGCFWGAERLFWTQEGVYTTAVGYAGGFTDNPTYEEVCSGDTGHTEVVLVVYDPGKISLDKLLEIFWTGHDPTQGMRQGNDIGTQYRSAIYVNNKEDLDSANASMQEYQQQLHQSGFPKISTEIELDRVLYYAEEYHQQYLGKNPAGYCGLRGTGVDFLSADG